MERKSKGVEKEIHGVKVLIRRTPGPAMVAAAQAAKEKQPFIVLAAVVRNMDGTPHFASAEEAADCDWEYTKPFLEAMNEVNGLKVQAATKN